MKQEKDCYCCADKATIEHKQTMKVNFCNKHNIIDFYKQKIAEIEVRK